MRGCFFLAHASISSLKIAATARPCPVIALYWELSLHCFPLAEFEIKVADRMREVDEGFYEQVEYFFQLWAHKHMK